MCVGKCRIGPSRFEFNGVSSSTRGSVARTIEASRDNRRLNTDSDSLVSYYNEQGCTPFQSIMPEISTGCLLSAMFVDIIRASIHDRDIVPRPSSRDICDCHNLLCGFK